MARITEIMADMEKVEKGRWVDYAADIKLLVANINSSDYREARQRILRPHQRGIRSGMMIGEMVTDLLKPAVARHLLLGWQNLQDEKGKNLPYSADKALEFFKNPAFVDLYFFVLETAGESEMFRKAEFEDSTKNSVIASGGN
ncbi:MAG TPA: hypothetical protein VMW24_00475 [Sedimentisphaerales bacterium]|nr:hypothetical protein [Sedimentisphaerales bacterium]